MKMKKNIYEGLQIVDFKNIDELIDAYIETLKYMDSECESYYPSVDIFGKSEFIWTVFKKVLNKCRLKVGAITIRRDYFDDEQDVFCLRVFDDNMLVIEEAYNHEDKPYLIDGCAFINQDECAQDLIDMALENDSTVILFGFNDEKEEEQKEEEDKPDKDKESKKKELPSGCDFSFIRDDDGVPHGIRVSKKGDNYKSSLYYYGSEPMTRKKAFKILDEFDF